MPFEAETDKALILLQESAGLSKEQYESHIRMNLRGDPGGC